MKTSVSSLLAALATLTLPLSAKLTAWYPLDEAPNSPATVAENVADLPSTLVGFDADPTLSFIERGHPSATTALGTSYLISKGGAINLGDTSPVQPTDQFTISFFYQPVTFDAFDRILESQAGNDNTQNGIRIDTGGLGSRVRVLIRSNATSNTQLTHPLELKNDGTWYFCAVRYDSTIGDGNALKLTVVELGETPLDEAAITAGTNSPAALNTGPIGFSHALETILGSENATATGNNTLNAALDEFAFYDNSDANGVLTDSQLADGANFGPSGVELITSFSSNQQVASVANPATLSWTINEPFDTLTLDDGTGTLTDLAPLTTAGSGSTMVTPSATTTYYLKGVNGDVENVHILKLLSGAAPEITSFASSSSAVNTGGNVDLSWAVIGADTISFDPGAVDVSALATLNQTLTATTIFTLSATNPFGTTTENVIVNVIDGPIPAHSHIASLAINTTDTWIDQLAGKNLNIINLLLDTPLTTASANTNITSTYLSGGGNVAGSGSAFQFPESTFEIWFRPAALTADHQVIFETGGGQNGISALINEDGLRFLGSAGDTRTLDLVVPLTGINFSDFVQLTFSLNTTDGTFQASLRDTFGAEVSASETANIALGGTAATLFNYGAGGAGGNTNALGGKTEAAGTDPAGLSSFTGEIAIFNVYDRILDANEITETFVQVAPNVTPQTGEKNAITNITYDGATEASLTWNSVPGTTYDAEFSTDLINWTPFGTTTQATDISTTNPFTVPAAQPRLFLRIIEVTP